ncbi:NAD(P)H-binding protein [Kribbella sp. CA-294648]|uniref:NAD(P)H-binding protein n=1 Tax=Kribbella sp. CA-294648 TaxID=3239948 RepID=UPI003D92DCCD
MKVFQIGAAGGVGHRLTRLLAARGDTVTGMHRAPAQGDTISEAGGTPVTGDLIADSAEALAGKMRGHDAVVFSAGAHGTGRDKTTLIDGEGLAKAADAAVALTSSASAGTWPWPAGVQQVAVRCRANWFSWRRALPSWEVRPVDWFSIGGPGKAKHGVVMTTP